MPYGQQSSRRPWGTAQSPHTADGAVCLPASHTKAPRRRHKPGWYPSISPGGFNFTGAQITLQDNEIPQARGPGHNRGFHSRAGRKLRGWDVWLGRGPPQDCSPCNRAEFKVLPSHGTPSSPGLPAPGCCLQAGSPSSPGLPAPGRCLQAVRSSLGLPAPALGSHSWWRQALCAQSSESTWNLGGLLTP